MVKLKLILTFLTISLMLCNLNAQETKNYKTEKFRPSYGDMGIYLGLSGAELEEYTDENLNVRAYPLINIKYFFSDKIELRLGFQRYKETKKLEGDLAENQTGNTMDIDREGFWRISPGFGYHFTQSKWVDVYAGLELPFGVEKEVREVKWEDEATGDYTETLRKKSTKIIGYSAFIGIQAFVADLPLAFGFEYGISGYHHLGLQYETEYSEVIGGNAYSSTHYTTEPGNTRYDDLKYRKFTAGNDIRFTISYYFKL